MASLSFSELLLILAGLGLIFLFFRYKWRKFLERVKNRRVRRGDRGKVIGIADGDTVHVMLASGQRIRVRLFGMDAPESHQPLGADAKAALAAICQGAWVSLYPHGQDRHSRLVARLFVGSTDVGLEMIRQGWAWVLTERLRWWTRFRYQQAFREARLFRRGIHRAWFKPPAPHQGRHIRSQWRSVTEMLFGTRRKRKRR